MTITIISTRSTLRYTGKYLRMDDPQTPKKIQYTPEERDTLAKGVREHIAPTWSLPAFVSDSKSLTWKPDERAPVPDITKKSDAEVRAILAEREQRQQEQNARRGPAEQNTYPNPTTGLRLGGAKRDDTRDSWYVREQEERRLQDKLQRLSTGHSPLEVSQSSVVSLNVYTHDAANTFLCTGGYAS